jgi:hypothetical protein
MLPLDQPAAIGWQVEMIFFSPEAKNTGIRTDGEYFQRWMRKKVVQGNM